MTPPGNDVTTQLSGPNRRTHAALFRHPPPDDLEWRDVRALLAALAELQEGRKGLFKATRRGVMATFRAPRDREPLSADELVDVQRFLERSSEGVSMPVVAEGTQLLVAIDADRARIYRIELHESVPRRLVPFHGNGYAANLRSSGEGRGGRQPLRLGFYREIARALHGAEGILLLGCGADGAKALAALRVELRRGHADLSHRIVGARVVRGEHATEQQLLVASRAFYARPG